jgi:hypothetical protein
MYQNIFAIDEISFLKRKEKKEKCPEYFLNNFNYYYPKLEENFYLKYFIRELLFDIDILYVDEFLDVQFENSKNPDKLLKIITLKVIPAIDNIINNNKFMISEGGYYNEIRLDDGFIETEGIIKKENYEYSSFYHITALGNLTEDLKQRRAIVCKYVENIVAIKNNTNQNLITWSGKVSYLAFLIRNLVDEGYISPPKKKNKEINLSELSRQILASFQIVDGTTDNTLRVYLDSEHHKHIDIKKKFNNQGFHLPDSGSI